MKVKFTAKIIDDGNIVGKCLSGEEGIPSMKKFDLCTKEGFSRDFDFLEKTVLKTRNLLFDVPVIMHVLEIKRNYVAETMSYIKYGDIKYLLEICCQKTAVFNLHFS